MKVKETMIERRREVEKTRKEEKKHVKRERNVDGNYNYEHGT